MSSQGECVVVELLGKTHQIACPQGQEQALLDAVAYLNGSVDKVRERSAVRNDEKALLMAALNLCHELLEARAQMSEFEQAQSQLFEKLTQAVAQQPNSNNPA